MSTRGPGLIGLEIILGLLLMATARLAAPAPVAAGDPCYHGFAMPAHTVEATNEIKVAPCAFGPTVARVTVGSEVTFFNGPDFTHLITGANQDWGSRDVELRPGSTVAYTFDKPGVYPYACALHRGMSGTIVVGDAAAALALTGGAASGTTPTDNAITGQPAATIAPVAAAATTAASGPADGAPVGLAFVVGGAAGALVAGGAVWLAVRRRVAARPPVAAPADR